jgi:glucose-6-phosphate isomerase
MAITGDSGPLAELCEEESLPSMPVPAGVPGRFAVLSTVGLVPAALAGADIEGLLAGAQEVATDLTGSLFDCAPYAYGAVAYALEARGATVNAMMPYAESLERYAEWFAQLWAESLGKDGLGQLPQRALGATDQHSQLQYYRAGRSSAMLTVVRPRQRPELSVPTPEHDQLAYLDGTTLGDLIDTEYEATAASMAATGRPVVRVELEAIDAPSLGRLLYGMEAACMLSGELAGVDTFVQPAVEWGKRAARGLLRGEETDETRAVEQRTGLWID